MDTAKQTSPERKEVSAAQGQRALSFMGGSVLVTPTHVEFVFRDDDLEWDGNAYRAISIPESERRELGYFLIGTEKSA